MFCRVILAIFMFSFLSKITLQHIYRPGKCPVPEGQEGFSMSDLVGKRWHLRAVTGMPLMQCGYIEIGGTMNPRVFRIQITTCFHNISHLQFINVDKGTLKLPVIGEEQYAIADFPYSYSRFIILGHESNTVYIYICQNLLLFHRRAILIATEGDQQWCIGPLSQVVEKLKKVNVSLWRSLTYMYPKRCSFLKNETPFWEQRTRRQLFSRDERIHGGKPLHRNITVVSESTTCNKENRSNAIDEDDDIYYQ